MGFIALAMKHLLQRRIEKMENAVIIKESQKLLRKKTGFFDFLNIPKKLNLLLFLASLR